MLAILYMFCGRILKIMNVFVMKWGYAIIWMTIRWQQITLVVHKFAFLNFILNGFCLPFVQFVRERRTWWNGHAPRKTRNAEEQSHNLPHSREINRLRHQKQKRNRHENNTEGRYDTIDRFTTIHQFDFWIRSRLTNFALHRQKHL